MNISTKGRYAIRALIEIARKGDSDVITVKEISRNQDISTTYLEQIMVKLKKASIVKSVRGAKGGFILNNTPDLITLYDILLAVEGPIYLSKCLNFGKNFNCKFMKDCELKIFWSRLSISIQNLLKEITLKEIIGEKNAGK